MLKRKGLYCYDGKKIWERYMSMGRAATFEKLNNWCLQEGMVNQDTNRVSKWGPKFSMWRYAIRNPEEAYESYKLRSMEYGEFPTFEEFCQDVADHAITRRTMVINYKEKERFVQKYLQGQQ